MNTNFLNPWRLNSWLSSSGSQFRELERLQRELERMNEGMIPPSQAFSPSCDIEESESHYLMSFDLPGVKKDDVKVSVKDNVLTVSGERKDEREEKSKNTYRSERYQGAYQRSFTLPNGVKSEQIEAEYRDGVLRLAIPKTAAAPSGRDVKIGDGKPGFFDRFTSHYKKAAEKVA